jgi:hypothetical protein
VIQRIDFDAETRSGGSSELHQVELLPTEISQDCASMRNSGW